VPDDPLLGVEIDQDQGPFLVQTDAGDHRSPERHKDRPHLDALERELGHRRPPAFAARPRRIGKERPAWQRQA
jgi:hypothetical protein